ncbi:MAG TPA: metallophosphoesterase [Verrucomicrobiae bacterium]|jgi:predicted phosphodiesterase|nr:metallophosphoesterase [Verrucomicrobiae bacterium]
MMKASPSVSRIRSWALGLLLFGSLGHIAFAQSHATEPDYSFFVAGDMRSFLWHAPEGKMYFDGACDAMKQAGPAAFLLSPGDCDPPGSVREIIDLHLGTNFLWYPLVGNHDVEAASNMDWWRKWAKAGIPHLVRSGPEGNEALTYSFDYGNSHIIMLDEYFNGHSSSPTDDMSESTIVWLEHDLAANHQPIVWVSGHKPIKSLPDMDTGRIRHQDQSIITDPDRRKRFLSLLRKNHVTGYICGHTHDCSIAKVDGIWQLDSGHCRGAGDNACPSTFLKIQVTGLKATVDVYRSNTNGLNYLIKKTVELN